MRRILVTGATGTVGSEVVSQLAAADVHVRAMTRNPDAATLPPEVETVRGDLTDVESLDRCLEGVDAVFLVWTASGDAAPAAIERIARRARRLVHLTSPHKTPHPLFQQPNPMRRLHAELERRIESSGIEWTFLRPGMFAANALNWWAPQLRAGDVVRWPYADAPTAPIHERDIAAVAARALIEDGHAGSEYMITGPESLTQREQVETIGRVLGRPIRFEELTPDEARQELGWPPPVADMLFGAWAAAIGQPAWITNSVAEVTGQPARPFAQWVRDRAEAFRA